MFYTVVEKTDVFHFFKYEPCLHMKVVAGLIRQDGKLLLSKRLPNQTFSNYWEIPGGKVEKNESEEDEMKRELDEEL